MTRSFDGATAVVTGASSGLGAEIARELARRGAHAVLVARREDRLGDVAESIRSDGGSATDLVCDVTDEQAVRELGRAVKSEFGEVRLLVNNAGRELMVPLQILKTDDARDLFEINVVSFMVVTRSLMGCLKKGSSVVNMASALAVHGAAAMSAYCASKGAIIAMTRSLARELAPRGIRVNAVAPGMVETDLLDRMLGKLRPEQVDALQASHPLGFGSPLDVANAVAFLGSADAAWITGHTLLVDGGLTA